MPIPIIQKTSLGGGASIATQSSNTSTAPTQKQSCGKCSCGSNSQAFNNIIGFIMFYRPDGKNEIDAIKIYYENRNDFSDSHSATYNSVQFAGRNEPVQIFYQGNERKFTVTIELIANTRHNGDSSSVLSKKIMNIPRDRMTILDVDYITRMAMSLTYCNYQNVYSGPHRVWLTYGNFIKMIPCVVTNVSRTFVGASPVDLSSGQCGSSSTDYLPFYQKLTIDLTASPEELSKCPDALGIMTDSNANKMYGQSPKPITFSSDTVYSAQTMQAFDFVRRVNLLLESGRRIVSQIANPFSSALFTDLKNSVTQYANLGTQFTGFNQSQLNDMIDRSLPTNKVRLYK